MNDHICRVETLLEMRDHHGHPFYDGGGGGEGGRGCIVRDVEEPGTVGIFYQAKKGWNKYFKCFK